jgi:hypothetical protein
MKSNLPTKIASMPPAEQSRKVLGFYFDSAGEIQILDEGLSKIERLALLSYAQNFCYLESRRLVITDLGKARLAETG